jgi:hypothetical protein
VTVECPYYYKENGDQTLNEIRTLMLIPFLLLKTISASAVERPFALHGSGVATLITNGSGNPIGAIPGAPARRPTSVSGPSPGEVKYTPDSNGVLHPAENLHSLLPTETSSNFTLTESWIQLRLLIRGFPLRGRHGLIRRGDWRPTLW